MNLEVAADDQLLWLRGEKFLIVRDGRVASRYPSGMKPTDSTFLQDIADVLQ